MTSPGGVTSRVDLSQPAITAGRAPSVDGVWCGAASISDEVSVLGVRELTPEEVSTLPPPGHNARQAELAAQRGQAPARSVERLKTRHHEIARLMAAGLTDTEVAETMAVSMPHLNLLKRSPAFQQLLFTYMSIRDQSAIDMGVRIKQAASLSLEKLTEKLAETDSTELPLDVLRRTTTDLLDRAGHSPVSKTLQLTGALSPQDIDDIKALHRPVLAVGTPPTEGPAPQTLEAQATVGSESGPRQLEPPSAVDSGSSARIEGQGLHIRALRSEGTSEEPTVRPSLTDLDLDTVSGSEREGDSGT